VIEGSENLAHVDHFFPHTLKKFNIINLVDGVWNLVLACQKCNSSKSARVPQQRYLERLYTRNEFLIVSHHPLRENPNKTNWRFQKR
jgi:5-methylcytosine-specific restriction endonuclease McrA